MAERSTRGSDGSSDGAPRAADSGSYDATKRVLGDRTIHSPASCWILNLTGPAKNRAYAFNPHIEVSALRPDSEFGGHGTQVDVSHTAGIVSINVMYPLEGCEDRALAVLQAVVECARSRHSGLVRTRVYKSLDGRTLATHAEWKSKAQFDAMLRDDEFVRRFNQLRELGIWESHVCELTDDIPAMVQGSDRA